MWFKNAKFDPETSKNFRYLKLGRWKGVKKDTKGIQVKKDNFLIETLFLDGYPQS